jgi:hypothetical protein
MTKVDLFFILLIQFYLCLALALGVMTHSDSKFLLRWYLVGTIVNSMCLFK